MIEKSFGKWIGYCDRCDNQIGGEFHGFYDVLDTMKKEGWGIEKTGNKQWNNYCQECLEQEKNKYL